MNSTEFGKTSKGEKATLYTFTNKNQMEMSVSDYGATLVNVLVPDKNGDLCDVVLGYDSVQGYEASEGTFFGATVGRSANRIGKATFTLRGTVYQLEKNDHHNNLHSGTDFYSKRMWKVEKLEEDRITFYLWSPNGDQGYPGEVGISVTYTLTEDNGIRIEYEAIPKEDTLLNLTNHSYFNLDGHASGTVLDHLVWMDAESYTRADEESIPTGELVNVKGTPMDFTIKKAIGREIEEEYEALNFGHGYDHNWVLSTYGNYKKVAELSSDVSKITMEVSTDLPGVQMYTGNFIKDVLGKGGIIYQKHQGVCFETQFFPDAIHKEQFITPITLGGERYYTRTEYQFKIEPNK
ncbi:MAG: aldose epimerase family protein [Lachnospiraceae bacterium]